MADQTKTESRDFSVRVAEILAYQQETAEPTVVTASGWTRAVPAEVADEGVVAGVLRRGCKSGRHLVLVETVAGDVVPYSLSDAAAALVPELEAQFQNEIAG
jgi:hypothetical protein